MTMTKCILFVALLCMVVARSDGGDKGMEAKIDSIDKESNTVTVRHATDPAQLNEMLNARVRLLTARYCGCMNAQMDLFKAEHGPIFWGLNKTDDTFYTLADRLLLIVKQMAAYSDAAGKCEASNTKLPSPDAKSFWVLECLVIDHAHLIGTSDKVPIAVEAALLDIKAIVECARTAARLALAQLDVEYKRDGLKKVYERGQMTAQQYDEAMAKTRIPHRVDYIRATMLKKRRDDAAAAHKKETNTE